MNEGYFRNPKTSTSGNLLEGARGDVTHRLNNRNTSCNTPHWKVSC